MNFIHIIENQKRALQSYNYIDILWQQFEHNSTTNLASLEDEELFRNHIPLEFAKFLKKCLLKLRELKSSYSNELDWSQLDEKYLNTLLYFALQYEDVNFDGALYAANIFFLMNTLDLAPKSFFNKVTYVKILHLLSEFHNSQELVSEILVFLMDDFKLFLSQFVLPNNYDIILSTVSVVHDYTYYSTEVFEMITADISHGNLGYIAFVSLQELTQQLLKRANRQKNLYPILLCLTSSLKSATTNNISTTVKLAHQRNVRLFIKQNFSLFYSQDYCLVTSMLEYICWCSDYDEFEAIALLIQQMPRETYLNIISFLQKIMLINNVNKIKPKLKLILPIFHHPPSYDTNRKLQMKIFIHNVIMVLLSNDEQIKEDCIEMLAQLSEDHLGKRILKKIMAPRKCDYVNRNSVQDVLHRMVDKSWRKKKINVHYIQLMCNFLLIRKDLISIKCLNRIRDVCLVASPYDLKPCLPYLKCLLKTYATKVEIVMYILSIFINKMFHPTSTAATFAKDLHEFIFSCITCNTEDDFIWSIINCLVSNNFDVTAIFEKFNSLNLLCEQQIRTLLESKIQDKNSRTPALKLVGVMLQFVPYGDCHCLHKKLEESINDLDTSLTETDQYLILYGLTKIMDRKNSENCGIYETNEYRKMQVLISQTFFDQMFPSSCVSYVIVLLSLYSNLTGENINWDAKTYSCFEKGFSDKLTAICNRKLHNYVYLSRDISYISELLVLCDTKLLPNNFDKLKKIATIRKHTPAFSEYLKNNKSIWSACIHLYVKVCFKNSSSIRECLANLESIMSSADDYLQLQILYSIFDVCNIHLQYYDSLVPHLFNALCSKNAYVRFISSKILMHLISEDHLRLMDGQYYLFMGLLSDKKDVISRNAVTFIKNKFNSDRQQIITRYFTPSIIHYNYYYDHPTIKLSKSDQHLLKKRTYSYNDRASIYYYFYEYLAETAKFNILNQIRDEILAKILNRVIPWSPKICSIVQDILTVFLYAVPKDFYSTLDDTDYCSAVVDRIESDLLGGRLDYNNGNRLKEEALKNILTVLLQLLYSDITKNAKNDQNLVYYLLYTIVTLTDAFYPTVKKIVDEESALLKTLYKKLKDFYSANKGQFLIYLKNNPRSFLPDAEADEEVFYMQEFKQFELLSPHVIN